MEEDTSVSTVVVSSDEIKKHKHTYNRCNAHWGVYQIAQPMYITYTLPSYMYSF